MAAMSSVLTALAIDDGAEAEEYCDHDEDNDDGGRRAGGGGDLEAGGEYTNPGRHGLGAMRAVVLVAVMVEAGLVAEVRAWR